MGWHLDGLVTAVVGTHTHVQSADERVLPGGTAYITDVGMTGPHDSVIGVDKRVVLNRFLTSMPGRFDTARGDPRLHGVIVTADSATGRATAIERLNLTPADIEALRDAAGDYAVSGPPSLPFGEPARPPALQLNGRHGLRVDEPYPHGAGVDPGGSLGRRRDCEQPSLADRAPLLHAAGRACPAQGGDVPLGGPVSAVHTGRWAAGRRAGPGDGLRTEGRVSDCVRASAATRSRRPASRLRPAEALTRSRRAIRGQPETPAAAAPTSDWRGDLTERRCAAGHSQGAGSAASHGACRHLSGARAGRGRCASDRARHRPARAAGRGRRDHRRAGRRIARGSVGVQRGTGRPGDRDLGGPGHLRCRPRDRHDDQ